MHRVRTHLAVVVLLGALAALLAVPGALASDAGARRLAGTDRIATAVAISQARWGAGGAQNAVLARSDAFPDALAGSPLAVARRGPLLLTPSTGLDDRTRDELRRVVRAGGTVFLLGGTAALGPGVEAGLQAAGLRWYRIAGTDRYGTATAIAGELGHRDTVLLADGTDFRDALIAASAAPEVRGAVLLVAPGTVPAATASYLSSNPPARQFAVGAVAASAVPAAEALVGGDHHATSVRVARRFFKNPDRVGIATVAGFADALGGGAHIGSVAGPLLLVGRDGLSAPVEGYVGTNAASIGQVFVYGGTAVIADATAGRAATLAASVEGFSHRLARPAEAYLQGGGVENPMVGLWPIADERWFLPSTQTMRALMILVDFPDVAATRTPQAIHQRFAPLPTAWFQEASYGRFRFDMTPTSKWYRMSKPVTSYGVDGSQGHRAVTDFIAEATALADPDVDFRAYDAVWVFGPETPHVVPLLFRAFPGAGVVRDGKELRHGVTANSFFADQRPERQIHGIVTHEAGHLLGLPDLYGRPSPSSPDTHDFVGGWDMMGEIHPGAHFMAFQKHLLGWLDSSQLRGLRAPGTVEATLRPIEVVGGTKALVVPTGESTAIVAEVRRRIGSDAGLCDEGVLIYSVDSGVLNGLGPALVKQSQPSTAAQRDECGPLAAAPFDLGPGEVSTFTEGKVTITVLEELGDDYRVRATLAP